jgi:hypothetical protein
MTRKEALEQGSTRYFTGEPCGRGHVAERYTARGNCVECQEEARRREREVYQAAKEAVNGA